MMDLASAICADLDARSMPFLKKLQNVEFFEFFKRAPDPKRKKPLGVLFLAVVGAPAAESI
jgi:hypothetical protein